MDIRPGLHPHGIPSLAISSSSTMVQPSGGSSASDLVEKSNHRTHLEDGDHTAQNGESDVEKTHFEKSFNEKSNTTYSQMSPRTRAPLSSRARALFSKNGKLRPFRLLRQDIGNIRKRYISDWTLFNQLVLASAVYVFFTNILPGITFASDLYVLTGMTWGTIEVVFSTGLCGIIFAL
jgi:hypothetical protein